MDKTTTLFLILLVFTFSFLPAGWMFYATYTRPMNNTYLISNIEGYAYASLFLLIGLAPLILTVKTKVKG